MRRPNPPSPAAALEDDDLLSEILLRLPPLPSSLPRASLVCKRWRRLVADRAGFLRRFLARHRRDAPVLGFFTEGARELHFNPALEPPDRVPAGRFHLQIDDAFSSDGFAVVGCRHGLVLILNTVHRQMLVWDPVTGDQRRVALPPGLHETGPFDSCSAAVLRDAAGDFQFQVVVVRTGAKQVDARVYSSETGLWGDLVTAPLLSTIIAMTVTSSLVGGSLYWSLFGASVHLLEFDLHTRRLAVIPFPSGVQHGRALEVAPAEGGGLGLLCLSPWSAQLWKKKNKTDDDGAAASWALAKTIEFDKLFPSSDQTMAGLTIQLYREANNAVFVQTDTGIFVLHLDSLQLNRLPVDTLPRAFYPFAAVFTADLCIGDGYAGAELLPGT